VPGAEVVVEGYIYHRVDQHDLLPVGGDDAVIGIVRQRRELMPDIGVKHAKLLFD
jgi:hypothetical protein